MKQLFPSRSLVRRMNLRQRSWSVEQLFSKKISKFCRIPAETLSSFPASNLFHPRNIILCLFMLFLSLSPLSKLIPFYRFFPSLSSRNFPRERRTPRKGCPGFIWTGNSFQIFETDGVKTSSIRRPKTPAAELISGSKPWTWLGSE